jgi:hypothetical protein
MNTTTKALVATAAALAVTGLGATAASASSTPSDVVTVTAFHETIKPWDSISIPSLSCPAGSYLQNVDLSPGRIVPKGVRVIEPRFGLEPGGAIGVTIGAAKATPEVRQGVWIYPLTGTNADGAISTATNWDPASSHDLIVQLSCTTDITKAAFAYAG